MFGSGGVAHGRDPQRVRTTAALSKNEPHWGSTMPERLL